MAKRKRLEKACINCNLAKSKCSGFRPCKRCINRDATCEDLKTKEKVIGKVNARNAYSNPVHAESMPFFHSSLMFLGASQVESKFG